MIDGAAVQYSRFPHFNLQYVHTAISRQILTFASSFQFAAMALKLHGSPTPYSQPTIRVLHILKEKNIPFEFIPIDMRAGQHKSPEHLEKQPFGQLPFIEDDGLILYETRAICRYIALKYRDQGTSLIPDISDLKATALFEQAASIEQNNFEPYALGLVMEKLYKEYVVYSFFSTFRTPKCLTYSRALGS
jgi:glutathione S-transferase